MMKIEAKYQGKWIATKNEKVLDSGTSLQKLVNRFENSKDAKAKDIHYMLIPKGLISGALL